MNTKEYYLLCVAEEALEVAHAIHKVLRFTSLDADPRSPDSKTNIENVNIEFSELLSNINSYNELVPRVEQIMFYPNALHSKRERLAEFFNISKELGVVKES